MKISDPGGASSASSAGWIYAGIAAILASGIFLLPQFLAWRDGFSSAYFLKDDEPLYAARLVRLIQGVPYYWESGNWWETVVGFFTNSTGSGGWGIGNPWTYENRGDPVLIPGLAEWTLGGVLSFFCVSVDTMSWLTRGLCSALMVLGLWRLFLSLGMRLYLSVLVSFWAIADAGVFDYKPLEALWGKLNQHPFNRFSNPLFGLTLFLFTVWIWSGFFTVVQLSIKDETARIKKEYPNWNESLRGIILLSRRIRPVLAGALLASLFYVSIYYWTHGLVGFFLGFLLIKQSRRWENAKKIILGGLVALILVIPYAIGNLSMSAFALKKGIPLEELIWRTGIFVQDRGWYLLSHKALWLFVLASLPLLFSKEVGRRFLGAFILAGFLCFMSSLFTGVTLQNFHWHYTLSVLALGGVFWVLDGWIVSRFSATWLRLLATLMAFILPLASGIVASVREYQANLATENSYQSRNKALGNADKAYGSAWHWLSKNARPHSVVLADPGIMRLAPVRSGVRIWQDSAVELVASQEILQRNHVLWYLQGLSSEELLARLAPQSSDDMPVGQWVAGLSKELVQEMKARQYPTLTLDLNRELAARVVQLHSQASLEDLRSSMTKFRLNYVVLGPLEKKWDRDRLYRLLEGPYQMKSVFSKGGVEIIKIERNHTSRAF